MSRTGGKPLTARQTRNRLLAALARAGREVDAAAALDAAALDGEGRPEALAFVDAIGGRVMGLRTTLAQAETDAAEVLDARRALRAEAEARASRRGDAGA